ncbi:PLP-dependent aminotransferase family protein [Paenibacillus sp. HN-1]|uniref:MocR-like pyridoxine biosynthesis transcription factor PdxR n=1 Tax=Paenibacillus TaxID=44249 RepID=UPI001CA877E8|nr:MULTISPECIES: PLP-dependent aminotransferase family protein [Paenibacillus]MBY9080583.1 PLP-dependent aminotransferase family protein [Paenibacillus sp. CGMCC 1.18879]MBY9085472.1 PLP-dependent aminotransferase family protein [Paenibacillus sinensis]
MAYELLIAIDKTLDTSLSRQVYEQILQAITSGCLRSGDQLPATRLLSEQILVSRSVILQAYEQLQAEGYLEMRRGAGTFIASNAASAGASPDNEAEEYCEVATRAPTFATADSSPTAVPYDFRHGVPAWDVFPMDRWQRALTEACRRATPDMLTYGPAEGSLALREEIARLVRSTRSIPALPEQIVITTGATQALDILARLCLNNGDPMLVEDPTHNVLREIFAYSGGEVIPVPVDQEGICVQEIDRCLAAYSKNPTRTPKLLYVTPSHQFPIGVTMSFNRRIQLLEWARRSGALIIEDDYDSEYRYVGQKVSALAGLDSCGRVVYVGSFSKILFPALRIGYVILPPSLVEPFLAIKWITDRMSPTIEQEALTDFIQSGQYAKHVSRMGKLYGTRRACLVDALQHEFDDRVKVIGDEAGLHLLIELDTLVDERIIAERALAYGVKIYPASEYFLNNMPRKPTFILGYANLSEYQIRMGIKLVARAEQECRSMNSVPRIGGEPERLLDART